MTTQIANHLIKRNIKKDLKSLFNIVNDINIFEIFPDNEWKGKTEAALRIIPIHPKLIELGLLEYIANRKRKLQKRLSPDLTEQATAQE